MDVSILLLILTIFFYFQIYKLLTDLINKLNINEKNISLEKEKFSKKLMFSTCAYMLERIINISRYDANEILNTIPKKYINLKCTFYGHDHIYDSTDKYYYKLIFCNKDNIKFSELSINDILTKNIIFYKKEIQYISNEVLLDTLKYIERERFFSVNNPIRNEKDNNYYVMESQNKYWFFDTHIISTNI
jgi:hypothetical protein